MVDIHSHVLFGVDDGAKTLEESIAMVKIAAEAGTTDLVATPHADLRYRYDEEIVLARIAELTAATGGIVKLYPGCDFHVTLENVYDALENPRRYAINQRAYVLVELAEHTIPASLGSIYQQMMSAGMIPVITHPERNMQLQKMRRTLTEWVRMGCLIQVTGGSYLGRFGAKAREFAIELLESNLVHFVASDAHDTEHRPPRLDEAREFIAARCGAEVADRLTIHNPRATLNGERIDPGWVKRPRKWFRLGF